MAKTRAGRKPVPNVPPFSQDGQLYFLGIGIDVYQAWPSLRNAVRDVRAVANLLTQDFGLARSNSPF